MSGSVGKGVDKALDQWVEVKERAGAEKEMKRFLTKLMKAPVEKGKKGKKGKGGKKG